MIDLKFAINNPPAAPNLDTTQEVPTSAAAYPVNYVNYGLNRWTAVDKQLQVLEPPLMRSTLDASWKVRTEFGWHLIRTETSIRMWSESSPDFSIPIVDSPGFTYDVATTRFARINGRLAAFFGGGAALRLHPYGLVQVPGDNYEWEPLYPGTSPGVISVLQQDWVLYNPTNGALYGSFIAPNDTSLLLHRKSTSTSSTPSVYTSAVGDRIMPVQGVPAQPDIYVVTVSGVLKRIIGSVTISTQQLPAGEYSGIYNVFGRVYVGKRTEYLEDAGDGVVYGIALYRIVDGVVSDTPDFTATGNPSIAYDTDLDLAYVIDGKLVYCEAGPGFVVVHDIDTNDEAIITKFIIGYADPNDGLTATDTELWINSTWVP